MSISNSNNLSQPTIKSDEIPSNLEGEEISKLSEGKMVVDELAPKLKVLIENNPAIEQSISIIREEVKELYLNPKKETITANKIKSDEEKAKQFRNLNDLLANDKVKAMVNMIGDKEARGIMAETLRATNSSKSILDKQTAIIEGVKRLQSANVNDPIIDFAKNLVGLNTKTNKQ